MVIEIYNLLAVCRFPPGGLCHPHSFHSGHPRSRRALGEPAGVRADLKSNHLVTKRCPLLPWNSGVAAGVLVGPN